MIEELTVSDAPQGTEGTTEVLRRGFRGSVTVMVCRILGGIAGLAFSVYTARLPESEYAALRTIRSLVVVGTVLASLGINPSLHRFLPELLGRRANSALRRLLLAATAIKMPVLFFLALFLLVAYGPLDSFFHFPEAVRTLLPLVVAYLIAVLLSDFLANGILASFLDQAFTSIVTVFMVAGYTIATVWSISHGYGLRGVLWSQVSFLALALVAFTLRTGWRIQPVARGEPGTAMHIRPRVIRFAALSALMVAGGNMRNAAVDILVISRYFGDWEVTLYGFASGMILMAYGYTPMASINNILVPLVAREYSRTRDRERLVFFYRLATKLAAHTSLPLLVGVFIFLPQIIEYIYDRPEWLPATYVGRLFVAYMIFRLFSRAFSVLYSTLERPEFPLYALFFSALNIALLFMLVPRFGMTGAAFTTCGIAPFDYSYHWFILLRVLRLPLRFPWTSVFRVVLNLLPAIVFGLWLQPMIRNGWMALGGLLLFWLVYFVFALVNRIYDARERALLSRTMGRWSRFF